MTQPDMKIELVPIADLKPSEYNPRALSTDEYANLKASLERFGFVEPLVVNRTPGREQVIIGGHQRFYVARELGLTHVPCHYVSIADPDRERELNLRLNRNVGHWDWDELANFDLDLLREVGFTANELNQHFDLHLDEPVDAPVAPSAVRASRGQVYALGRHRLMCGDATDADDVRQLLGTASPMLMVTDPPYGVSYDPHWRVRFDGGGRHALGQVMNDDQADWSRAIALFPGDVAYVWHASVHAVVAAQQLTASGFDIRAQIVWVKQHFVFSRGHYHWQHESCWYAIRRGRSAHWQGGRAQTTVWEVPNLNSVGGGDHEVSTGHGTQKPLEVMRRPIVNHLEVGGIVYDPFLGSGTTLLAAEMMGRTCYGLEIDPVYCDLTIQRYCEAVHVDAEAIYADAVCVDV